MSAQAIVCTNCGAGLEPKVLESKVKCNYCMTVFVITRDTQGLTGIALEGSAPAAPASALPTNAPQGPIDPIAAATGLDPRTVERLERDAMAVVGGLMAAEARQVARGRGSCALVGLLLFASSFGAVECAWRILHG